MLLKARQADATALRREFERDPALLGKLDQGARGTTTDVAVLTPDLMQQPHTDAGNAERLNLLHGEDMRYVHEWRCWIFWNGSRWCRNTTGAVERFVIDTARETYKQAAQLPKDEKNNLSTHARKSEATRAIKATLEIARCMEGVTISARDLDADPFLLGVANGVVDLRTRELLLANRDHLITKSARAKYDPHAKCERFLQFLSTAMSVRPDASEGELERAEERVRFLQKAVGVSLSGCVDDKAMFVLHGPTNSGKTTFLESIRWMLGDYAGQILIDSLLSNSRQSDNNSQADLADMHGLRFVTTSEAESSQQLAEGKLKYLTQGQSTKIKVARKYENPFEFSATHKLWLDANELPRIKTSDDSVWNRLKPIPFEFRVPDSEIDLKLPQKLRAEADGILSWAVEGFSLRQKEGLGDPPDVAKARREWQEECDPLADFIAECCQLKDEEWVSASDLRRRYESWCSETGEKYGLRSRAFGTRLKALGCINVRRTVSGKSQRGWAGIRLR